MAEFCDSPDACVDAILKKVGNKLVVGAPLGAGKANHLMNAVYARAQVDSSIDLTILSALTLQRPTATSDLQARFLGPMVERVFGNYPDLAYELDRVAGKLPANVRVLEFYFAPAKYKGKAAIQRDYISSNYTHAARDILDRGINVLMQQVAFSGQGEQMKLSLSCNPDLTVDLMPAFRGRDDVAVVLQTNSELPFMYGDAEIGLDDVDFIVDDREQDYRVFGPPKMAVGDAEHAIGLYCSALVRDGGELQVGIGALGDAIVHSLLLRHEKNDAYQEALQHIEVAGRFAEPFARMGSAAPFEEGLFAASEMLVDGFLPLFQRGVIKRKVYDDVHLQRLLNAGAINEQVNLEMLDALLTARAISSPLDARDVRYLQHYGILRDEVALQGDRLTLPGAQTVSADIRDAETRQALKAHGLGEHLKHGAVMHGGFFLGNQAFYQGLKDLPEAQRRLIRMRAISRTNQLYGHEAIDRLHRRHARFVNTCMMVTLSGAAVSDGLEDGTVISGVGGQYNFVAMAQELPDGHSILNLRSTRTQRGVTRSSIVWNYGHITIPRHLRDVYVTEYGIAFVRGKTDGEVIEELLKVTDSRFQPELVQRAKAAGKLRADYEVPDAFRNNTPDALQRMLEPLKQKGLLPKFPLGCDFTDEELKIGKALKSLKARADLPLGMPKAVLGSLGPLGDVTGYEPLLQRMKLDAPKDAKERLYRRLLLAELKRTGA